MNAPTQSYGSWVANNVFEILSKNISETYAHGACERYLKRQSNEQAIIAAACHLDLKNWTELAIRLELASNQEQAESVRNFLQFIATKV